MATVAAAQPAVGRTRTVEILCGSRSKLIEKHAYDGLPAYGTFAHLQRPVVLADRRADRARNASEDDRPLPQAGCRMSAALAPELLRVGVLASGTGTNLQALFDRVHGQLVEVVAVASDQVDAQALVRAQRRSVPTAVFAKQAYVSRQQRDLALADWLQSQGVQLVVLAGYMSWSTAPFCVAFPKR